MPSAQNTCFHFTLNLGRGVIFLCVGSALYSVAFGALLYTLLMALMNLTKPGVFVCPPLDSFGSLEQTIDPFSQF